MKNLPLLGGILFALGFAVATGVEKNPIQAIYAVVLMGGAWACFHVHERYEHERENDTEKKELEKELEMNSDIQEAA